MWDSLIINANLATFSEKTGYGVIRQGAMASKNGKIAWIGRGKDLPATPSRQIYDADGLWLTPGLIDCHTHLVYAGNRAHEFEQRLTGVSYEEIARQGGGILSTVTATRKASEEDLFLQSAERLHELFQQGVTTVEIKSGYGLDLKTEEKILKVATRLAKETGLRIQRTFLGAHALPPEFKGKADAYIDLICKKMIPHLARKKLADGVDVFCEGIGFTPQQTERVFKAAKKFKLAVHLHADQLSDLGGAGLAAKHGALSADHLEHTNEQSVRAMKKSGTVAVLLPGAFYYLRDTNLPPIGLFRKHKVPIAVATDSNPGTSPTTSLLLMLNMASTLFRLTPEEALRGVTINAAKALGLEKTCGQLKKGMVADAALWDITEPAELCYHIAKNPCRGVVLGGQFLSFD